MGSWGMGISQSDEYCEIYERFMDLYDDGKETAEITKQILEELHREFDDADGIMHDVYFALAKAEWMCGSQSEYVVKRVREIIETDANIAFLRELEVQPEDLKQRKKYLKSFLASLEKPRKKPRKRYKKPVEDKDFPMMKIGDCFAYKYGESKRIFIVLDRYQERNTKEQVLVCILKKTFDTITAKSISLWNEEIGGISAFVGVDFLGKSSLQKVQHLSLPSNLKQRILHENEMLVSKKTHFKTEFSGTHNITLSDLCAAKMRPELCRLLLKGYIFTINQKIQKESFPPKWYILKKEDRYKAFVVCEPMKKDKAFCYIWKEIYDKVPAFEELQKGQLILFDYRYLAEFIKAEIKAMPAIRAVLQDGGIHPELSSLVETDPLLLNEKWMPILNGEPCSYGIFDDYPEELCMQFEKVLAAAKQITR